MTAFLLALLTAGDGDWSQLRVTMTTTSDRSFIRIKNAPRSWVQTQLVRSASPVKLEERPLFIGKPPFDRTETTLTATVYLQAPKEGPLTLVVGRGDVGETRVRVEGMGEFVHDRNTGDGQNLREFEVPAGKLRIAPSTAAPRRPASPKLALAFYYLWYGTEQGPSKRWVHWDPKNRFASTNTPSLGPYDSQDEAVLKQHVAWARTAGLDGFICSWWGPDSFEDRAMKRFLRLAEREKFRVSAYYEPAPKPEQIRKELDFLIRTYGASPAWIRWDGKPVIFVYARVSDTVGPETFDGFRDRAVLVMDTYDLRYGNRGGGVHTYNPGFHKDGRRKTFETLRNEYVTARAMADRNRLVFAATVLPGYDDTVIRKPGLKLKREGGRLYDGFWEAALAGDPDWMLLTSFNEWHEGSEIEPSQEFGDAYLKRTASWVGRWKTGAR